MKAKVTKAELDSLDKALQGEYAQQSDGSFLLRVDPVDGLALGPLEGKQRALDAERKLREQKEKVLEAFLDEEGNVIDGAKAKAALKKLGEMKDWKPDDKVREQIESIRTQLTETHGKEKKELSEKMEKLERWLDTSVVDAEMNAAIADAKADPMISDSIRRFIKREHDAATDRQVARVYKEDGTIRYTEDASRPMTPKEFVKSLEKVDRYRIFFPGTGQSGTGTTSPGRAPASGKVTITRTDARDHAKWEAAEKMAQAQGQKHLEVVDG